MLIISKIRGKDLGNRFLPRFFLLIFCTLRKQNVLTKYPILLTRFFEHVDQTKKTTSAKTEKNPSCVCDMLTRIWDNVDQIYYSFSILLNKFVNY